MIICGDALTELRKLPNEAIQCCVTSPPYWGLRDYGVEGQFGLEKTPEEYLARMVETFREVRRALKNDGTLWLNLGDSYAGSWGATSHDIKGKARRTGSNSRPPNSYVGVKWRSGATDNLRNGPQGNRNGLGYVEGLKPKDLVGIPWMVAFALRADGWYLRQDIIWAKPNPMPESITDRCTKSHEYIFLLSKSARYYYNAESISEKCADATLEDGRFDRSGTEETLYGASVGRARGLGRGPRLKKIRKSAGWDTRQGAHGAFHREGRATDIEYTLSNKPTRNKRSVWTVATKPFSEAHFATFPPDLIAPCVLAGSKPGDLILDPFMGAGTTALVALRYQRQFIGVEINPEYIKIAEKRIEAERSQLKMAL